MWALGFILLTAMGWDSGAKSFETREMCAEFREAMVSAGPSTPGYLFVTPCMKVSDGPNQEETPETPNRPNLFI